MQAKRELKNDLPNKYKRARNFWVQKQNQFIICRHSKWQIIFKLRRPMVKSGWGTTSGLRMLSVVLYRILKPDKRPSKHF